MLALYCRFKRKKKQRKKMKQPPKAQLLTCPSTFSDETASSGCWSTKTNTAVCVTFDQSGVGCLHAGSANPYLPLAVTPYLLLQIGFRIPSLEIVVQRFRRARGAKLGLVFPLRRQEFRPLFTGTEHHGHHHPSSNNVLRYRGEHSLTKTLA